MKRMRRTFLVVIVLAELATFPFRGSALDEAEVLKTLERREGRFVALELRPESWAVLENPEQYLSWLDGIYEAYVELVGSRPFNGEKMRILEVPDYPGGWAVAGQPIRWHGVFVPDALRKVNGGDVLFGIIHEMGHNFDLDYRWVWHAEFSANFKMVYAMEQTGLKVGIGARGLCDYSDPEGLRLDGYYRDGSGIAAAAMDALDEKPLKDWFSHSDAATHKFLLLKDRYGWEPFKGMFREFQALPADAIPDTVATKLGLLIHLLSKHAGKDLWGQFERWGFVTTRPIDYHRKMTAEVFGRRVRKQSQLLETLEVFPPRVDSGSGTVAVEFGLSRVRPYTWGLRTHANSRIVYALGGGKYALFEGTVSPIGGGEVEFIVRMDGQEAWRSGKMSAGRAGRTFRLPVAGAERLELVVDACGNIGWDSADWVEVRLTDVKDTVTYLDDLEAESAAQDYDVLKGKRYREGPDAWPHEKEVSLREYAYPEADVRGTLKAGGKRYLFGRSDRNGIYRCEVPGLDFAAQEVTLEVRCGRTVQRRMYPAGTFGTAWKY